MPRHAGTHWQTCLPPSTTPSFDQQILALVYGTHADEYLVAQALAAASDEQWAAVVARWDAIRSYQRAELLAHPGHIPDTHERQRWLSRLRAARPRVLAMAEYARVRQAVQPIAAGEPRTRRPDAHAAASRAIPSTASIEHAPTQQPHFSTLDHRDPKRLSRIEPNDRQFERDALAEALKEEEQ